jgi:hypothetical protein
MRSACSAPSATLLADEASASACVWPTSRARFAEYRELDPEAIAATFYAGALHGIGAVRMIVPRDASPRAIEITGWDHPFPPRRPTGFGWRFGFPRSRDGVSASPKPP